MTTLVFLGPSLDRQSAEERLHAFYAPPVRRGDIARAVHAGAERIALIDGEFGQSLAVTVLEIRAALQKGVEVWGSSSMGALRAAECHRLGMHGAGWVFAQYASGALTADDEVALLFDPQSRKAQTVPLVNLRWTVSLMRDQDLLPARMADEVVRIGASIHFSDRSRAALSFAARQSPAEESMESVLAFMKENPRQCDRKQLDALLLLDRLATA